MRVVKLTPEGWRETVILYNLGFPRLCVYQSSGTPFGTVNVADTSSDMEGLPDREANRSSRDLIFNSGKEMVIEWSLVATDDLRANVTFTTQSAC